MQQIVNFIIRNKTFLLFLLLFSISILFTIQSHSYHKSKFINSANFLTGGIYNASNNLSQYFNLKFQNRILLEENNRLKSILFNSKRHIDSIFIDSTSFKNHYRFTSGKIIRNSYAKTNNVLLIDKGIKDGINEDYGVITNKGILGIINNTSDSYATIVSILNTTNSISAKLKKTNHFGSLTWNAKTHQIIQLTDIPKIANIIVGDTVVTSGLSSIFPEGINIGTVENFELDKAENFYEINVKLFNDMTSIEYAYIIENIDIKEITNLLKSN